MNRVSADHPRPQLQRAGWVNLNGVWEFALDRETERSDPGEVRWDSSIVVPFAPETELSGIAAEGFLRSCWYRRRVDLAPPSSGERVFLEFGAVDYIARVWVDGCDTGSHEGGFTPFSIDITDALSGETTHEIIVHVEDDPLDLAKPRGKQDWETEPHQIWYPRTTGIWQTVWLERRPAAWIDTLSWDASLAHWDIGCEVTIGGGRRNDDLRLEVVLTTGEGESLHRLAHDIYSVDSCEVHRRIALSDPGVDDFRNDLLWSPDSPTIIDARLRLLTTEGDVLDEVLSYTALRSFSIEGDRFVLNGRQIRLRLVLDQGYWPQSGMTAPNENALRCDVELAKAMGFNGVRKHQKIEDPRYLYWADHIGLLVWEEMPSAYRFTRPSIERLTREWMAALQRDMSHPCIITWVPFNESWGVPNLPNLPPQQSFVQALYFLTKSLDPTRPVVGNDGWESAVTDIIGIHDYESDPSRLKDRYWSQDDIPTILHRARPGGRMSLLAGHEHAGQPIVLTEFGGISYAPPKRQGGSWGYSVARTPKDLEQLYDELMRSVHELSLFAGFCYTQFADTYQETNGLLFADRRPKFPLEQMAAATRGPYWKAPPGRKQSPRRKRDPIDSDSVSHDPTRSKKRQSSSR